MHKISRDEYVLKHSKRKTIAIYVRQDQSIEVRAPIAASRKDVEGFLQQKSSWIRHKQQQFRAKPARETQQFHWGSLHYFLGQRHFLVDASEFEKDQLFNEKIVESGWQNEARYIALRSRSSLNSAAVIEKKLYEWYRLCAESVFKERLDYWRSVFPVRDLPNVELKIRRMKRRWGSCHRRGIITLNLDLIRYPMECIDCVIVHELCHFKEMNHSSRFYHWMDRTLPGWRDSDKMLNELAQRY